MKNNLMRKASIASMGALMLTFAWVMNLDAQLAKTSDEGKVTTVTGKLIDKETREPIVFANVYVIGTSISTVSNSDGEFILKIPVTMGNAQLGVAHLGYKNYQKPVSEVQLLEDGEIALLKEAIPIKEVIVRQSDPTSLLRGAMNNIEKNYSTQACMITGFYRETVKQNRQYVSIAEAVLTAYKAPYNKIIDDDRVKIFKGRKGQDLKRMDTVFFKFQGGPRTTFVLDVVKNPETLLSDEYMEYYDYKLVGKTTFSDKLCYVIEFDQKPWVDNSLFKGTIYLDVDNLAIAGLQFSLSDVGLAQSSQYLVKKKPAGMKIETLGANYLVNYSVLNNKWYLNYVRSELRFKCKWPSRVFTSNFTIMAEMAVTDVDTANVSKYRFSESAKMSDIFSDQVSAFYDENYWGDYNFIKPDENIQVAIERLSSKLRRRQSRPQP